MSIVATLLPESLLGPVLLVMSDKGVEQTQQGRTSEKVPTPCAFPQS